eukprot:6587582-Prymnesium_polylepis.1
MLVAPLAAATIGAVQGPSYFACRDSAYPFCNASLSIDARVDDLIGRLTLEEKAALITPNRTLGSTCNDHTSGVDRLDVPYGDAKCQSAPAASLTAPLCASLLSQPVDVAHRDKHGRQQRRVAALSRHRLLSDRCPGAACPPPQRPRQVLDDHAGADGPRRVVQPHPLARQGCRPRQRDARAQQPRMAPRGWRRVQGVHRADRIRPEHQHRARPAVRAQQRAAGRGPAAERALRDRDGRWHAGARVRRRTARTVDACAVCSAWGPHSTPAGERWQGL